VPLRDDLLNPIPGDNPSGVSLRYERIYDQIKEARTEDDDTLPSRGWERPVKKADYALVMKLAGEALATKSKDLQLAAWLTEAHVRREGLSQLQPCLQLMFSLQEQFWETVYPEIDEGDAGMRAVPVEWIANRLGGILRDSGITLDELSFLDYKASRTIGYEADAASSDAKREARERAIAEGKLTAEDFDKSFASTPKAFYRDLENSLKSAGDTVEAMQVFCEQRYGNDTPGFGKLKESLEHVGQLITSLLNEKLKLEPDKPAAKEVEPEPEPEPEAQETAVAEEVPAQAAKAPRRGGEPAEPSDWEDAVRRIQVCARFLQKEKSSSPVAYLLQTSIRLGEMREQGSWASYDFLVSPSGETRQNLKRLAMEENWEELLKAGIAAAGEPCGRAWLDLQRYIWKAASESSNSAIASTVVATVQSLLKDVPEIPAWTLCDDTPAANAETQKWLQETVLPKPPEPSVESAPALEPELPASPRAHEGEGTGAEVPDVLELARDFIRRGQLPQALQILTRDAAQQPSGRARFQRRLQIAQFCMNAGQGKIAYPVLEELVREIEERRLEEWESAEAISPPLALLLRCLDAGSDNGQREALFARLCRIDPIAAMDFSR